MWLSAVRKAEEWQEVSQGGSWGLDHISHGRNVGFFLSRDCYWASSRQASFMIRFTCLNVILWWLCEETGTRIKLGTPETVQLQSTT